MDTQLVRSFDSVYIKEGRLAVQRAELADANRDAVGLGGAASVAYSAGLVVSRPTCLSFSRTKSKPE